MKHSSHNKFTSSCLICDGNSLLFVPDFSLLPRITSDCRSFSKGGKLAVCSDCSLVQKIADEQWLVEIGSIYKDYAAYSVGGGEEQIVMDPQTGQARKRSEVLVQQLLKLNFLPEKLLALDVGCGHGVTLREISSTFPQWRLFGHEMDNAKISYLELISNFEKLYTGSVDDIDGKFGWVSMVHSLEHFVEPLKTMQSLHKIIEPNGHLFVEVCNVEENPFDLLIADHLTHFSPQTLSYCAANSGFQVVSIETTWVKKELSLLATPTNSELKYDRPNTGKEVHKAISSKVHWLNDLITTANKSALESKTFGIFGTSIAGSWLASSIAEKVAFFVDEDPNRIGREFMDKPIIKPESIPHGASVFLALAPILAKALWQRLKVANPKANYVLPE
jgi:2-polyprenyl-3-methyl-5-hydroxy-6-metoxy-1,4-benzoquinol methylase